MNSLEKFGDVYEKEKTFNKEIEKVEIASMKLKEKYKDYQELVEFIDYLRASEELFIASKSEKWTGEKLKEELIKNELHVAPFHAGIDEKVFDAICGDFKSLSAGIGKIYEVTDKLLEKYAECGECKDLILFIRNISVIFIEVEEKNISFDEAKDRLFMAKIKALSTGGKSELNVLEKIYAEFKEELNK